MSGRNEEILIGLQRSWQEQRMPHALLLSGAEGNAKLDCVERFAAFLCGPNEADQAQALERIRKRNHPDFILLEGESGTVGVEEVRELPRVLSFSPLEMKKRVIVIPSAANMNPQAANALLKILEEPPGHTMFFLFCRDPAELLATIRSRCQTLRFAPFSNSELSSFLGDAGSVVSPDLLAWSEGSLERANFLLAQEGWSELRSSACEQLLSLWEASPRISSSSAMWIEGVENEAQSRIVLDTWELLLRDFVFIVMNARAEQLGFPEFYSRLKVLSERGNVKVEKILAEICAKGEAINRFRVYRELNGNLRLDFAALLSEMQIFSIGNRRTPV